MLEEMLTALVFGFPPPPEMIDPRFPLFLQRAGGLLLTLLITILSLLIGTGLGVLLALARREGEARPRHGLPRRVAARALGGAAAITATVLRGLPIMLLVLLVFYLPYPLVGWRVPAFALAVAAFSLYAGAYLTETLRAGFRSVSPGLQEVGRVLGMTRLQVLLRIELPIVCRTMAPDLISLAITVFKDTSTLAVVAVPELTYAARQMLTSKPIEYEFVMCVLLAMYWVPAFLFSLLAAAIRRGGGGVPARA